MQIRALEKLPTPIQEEIKTLIETSDSIVVDVSDGKKGLGKHD